MPARLEFLQLGMLPKEMICHSFEDWASALFHHDCPSNFKVASIFLHTGFECRDCGTRILIPSGRLFHSIPAGLKWHMHSDEGMKHLLEKTKTGELLGVSPFFLPEPK